jgi:hypothetical protein
MAKRVLMATATVLALGVFGVSAASAATLTVCESGPPTCGFSHPQEAVNAASSGDTIEIAAGTYNLGPGEVKIGKNLTLEGAGAGRTVLNKEGVTVREPASVTITGVTIANGEGVFNKVGATLTLNNSVVKKNSAEFGGGMLNEGTATLNNSTVSGNSAERLGGGIENFGQPRGGATATLTLNNSTVSENSAGGGGGIFNSFGTVTVHNSTVSANRAQSGGGITNEISGTLTLSNSKVSDNTASVKGGGIYNRATVVGSNDTITGNTAPQGPGIFNEPPGTENLKNSKVQP